MKARRKKAPPRAAAVRGSGVYGIGVDILHVTRIEKVYARHGERFVERLLHPLEMRDFAKVTKPAQYLAKSFAIKEAFVKALGTGFAGVAHDEVGAVRNGLGKPELVYGPNLKRRLKQLGIRRAHVTLSDEGGTVCAVAVLER